MGEKGEIGKKYRELKERTTRYVKRRKNRKVDGDSKEGEDRRASMEGGK